MYLKYKKSEFVIIGFPSNSFNNEPGTNADIKNFYEKTFSVTFPIMSKVNVINPE